MFNQTKRRLGAVLLLCALALSGCSSTEEEVAETTVRETAVEVAVAALADMASESKVTGSVTAKTTVSVIPLLSGQVTELNVREGSVVTAGQVLFCVDTSSVTSSLGALYESYSATQALTQESITTAQTNLTNTEALYAVGAASQFALEQAQSAVVQAEASQTAQLASIQSSINQINTQVGYGTVTAPCDGLVTSVSIVQGGLAGQTTPAVTIAEGGTLRVAVQVSETIYSKLAVGDVASVSIASAFDQAQLCTIAELGVAASAQNNLYNVYLYVPDGNVAIGAFADVTFYTNVVAEAVQVPTEAVQTDGSTQYVFVVDDGGATVSQVTVTTGLVGDVNTQITSGLEGGEQVVSVGQSFLSDGAAVRVVEE